MVLRIAQYIPGALGRRPTGPQLESHPLWRDLGAVGGPAPPPQGAVHEHLSVGHVELQALRKTSLLQQGLRRVTSLPDRQPVGEVLRERRVYYMLLHVVH